MTTPPGRFCGAITWPAFRVPGHRRTRRPRNGLALVWKIVLVVELLGRPNGVGFQLHVYFQLFDVATILAYAIGFIVVVQAIEILLLDPWQRRATRWRR